MARGEKNICEGTFYHITGRVMFLKKGIEKESADFADSFFIKCEK